MTVLQPCQMDGDGCVASGDGLQVEARLDSRARALKPFTIRLQAVPGAEATIDTVTVDFTMAGMMMGINKYQMLKDARQGWMATVTLPICTSGRSDWQAEFDMVSKGRRWRATVPFSLHPAQ